MKHIKVSVSEQILTLFDNDAVVKKYQIATAKNGVGEVSGSQQTPRGRHIIRAKIGADKPANTVFVGRRATGEIYSELLAAGFPGRDWILTRILWLSGCEPGKNRLGKVDTMRRYIYIHGCPDSHVLGQPSSHGCIKMRNNEVIELFDLIDAGIAVLIEE